MMPKKRKYASLGVVRKQNSRRLAKSRKNYVSSPSSSPSERTVEIDTNVPKPSPLTDSSTTSTNKSETSWEVQRQQRITIFQSFTEHLDSPPESEDKSTLSKILKMFPNYSYHTVLNVIKETRYKTQANKLYLGTRKSRVFRGERMIPSGSIY